MFNNTTWRSSFNDDKLLDYMETSRSREMRHKWRVHQADISHEKWEKTLASNDQVIRQNIVLKTEKAALTDRVNKQYLAMLEKSDEVSHLRKLVKCSEEQTPRLSDTRNAKLINDEVIQSILKLDQKQYEERRGFLRNLLEVSTTDTSNFLSDNSSASDEELNIDQFRFNKSLADQRKSLAVTREKKRHTKRMTKARVPPENETEKIDNPSASDEELYIDQFGLDKSLADKRKSLAVTREKKRQTKRMTKSRMPSENETEKMDVDEELNIELRKAAAERKSLTVPKEKRRKTKRMSKAAVSSETEAPKINDAKSVKSQQKSSRTTVHFNFSVNESIAVLEDVNSPGCVLEDLDSPDSEDSKNSNDPEYSMVDKVKKSEEQITAPRSSRRNRKAVSYMPPKHKMRRGDAICANSLVLSFSPKRRKVKAAPT